MNNNINWKNVYIFISSTFNDMHAERDYLVKRVFPELRLWCAKRKLKLIDIDLRWGVSEKDATENKRVVDVCLKNIDKCRPFFLCFLGQRRGWIPTEDDINSQTCTVYPKLNTYLGKNSVTELEIIHALINPLDNVNQSVRHSFFYFRNPDYVSAISSPDVRKLFVPNVTDTGLEAFKQKIGDLYPVLTYEAKWNPKKISPELVNVNGMDLSGGRLEQFMVNGDSLKSSILEQLKAAIEEEFPGREQILESTSDLERELMHQDNYLFQACDSYIPRPKEEQKILDYINSNDHTPYILKAHAGSGKTSMLAHLLSEKRIPGQVFYRFAGTSADSMNSQRTLYLLAQEMVSHKLLKEEEVKKAEKNLLLAFPNLLKTASRRGSFSIVLDAIDQWSRGSDDILWIPQYLPDNIKLVISVKSDGDTKLLDALERRNLWMHDFGEMSSREEKVLFIQQYLSQFLKDISEEQIQLILGLKGTNNPLYMKIVLNELRIHGSFDTLLAQLEKDYGKTPSDAFQLVLERLETEDYSTLIHPKIFTMIFLGVMAYSLEAVDIQKYADIFPGLFEENDFDPVEIMDGVYTLARHLSPYMVIDGNHINFLYDSFRTAVKERYSAYEKDFHSILYAIYYVYCVNGNEQFYFSSASRSDIICLAHHALHTNEETCVELFSDPFFLLEFVKKAGSLHVSETMALADARGYQKPAFKELAECMQTCSVRIDEGPNTLFYELREEIGMSNAIVKKLLEQASSNMTLQYFAPIIKKEVTTAIPFHEMNYKEFPVHTQKYLIDHYLVYITFPQGQKEKASEKSVIYIQNLETEKIDASFEFPYAISRCSVDKNDLYIEAAADDDGKRKLEIYSLPSLECKMSRTDWPELPEDFHWLSHCHGYNGDFYEVAVAQTLPLRIRVYRLNDGKLMHESTYPVENTSLNDDQTVDLVPVRLNFTGPFLSEHNSDHCTLKLWFLPTDTLVYEDVQKQNPFCSTIDNDIFYYCKKFPDKKVYQYQFTNSSVTLLQQKELSSKTDFSIHCAEAALGHLFVIEHGGGLRVYDRELNFTGYLENGFDISFTDALPKHFYPYKGVLQLMEPNRLHLYKMDRLLGDLNSEPDKTKLALYREPFMKDNYLYLLSAVSQKINMETLRCECENLGTKYTYIRNGENSKSPKNIYRIGGKDYILGTYDTKHFTNKYTVVLKALDSLKLGLRYNDDIPENFTPNGAYYDNGKLGVLFHEDSDIQKYGKIKIQMLSLNREIIPCEIWEPDVKCECHEVISFYGIGDYLFCFNCYIDDSTQALRIYDLHTRQLIYTYKHEPGISFHTYEILVRNDWVYCPAHVRGTNGCILFEINPVTRELMLNTITSNEIGSAKMINVTDDSIYFYARFAKILYRYSLESHTFMQVIDIHERPGCLNAFEKYGAILNFQSDGICDVYDKNTGEHIMRQLFKHELEHVIDCPGKPWFYAGTSSQEYNFYGLTSTEYLLS